MFNINYMTIPEKRQKQTQKALKASALDNSKMVADVAESLIDLAAVVKDLSTQVAELSALVMANGSDDDDKDDASEDTPEEK